MTSIKRKRRYFGMTAGQIAMLLAAAALNCAIIGIGLALVLSPQAPAPASLDTQPISATAPDAAVTTPASRFPPTWTPTPTPQATSTRTPLPAATATRTPRPTIERPQLAAWDKLTSYRLRLNMRMAAGPASQSIQWKLAYEWVKEPEAAHVLLSIDGTGLPEDVPTLTIESIQIGNTAWSRMGGDWQVTAAQSSTSMQSSWNDVEKLLRDLQLVGEDTINGIRCKHYVVDENISGSGGLGSAQSNIQAEGDMWIAAQSDLPPVPVRVRLQLRAADLLSLLPATIVPSRQPAEQTELAYDLELDMTDINRPITIQPPPGFR